MWNRKNKYGNTKVEAKGMKFDSKKEYNRYLELDILQRTGVIEQLKRQVKFELIPKIGRFRAVNYIADFTYLQNGKLIVEDVKGFRTPVYRIKAHLMLWLHKIDVREV